MNLGELKASLSRMSPDLDDCEVVLLTIDKKEEKYDTLAFTSYIIVKGHENPIFMMGSHNAAMKMFKDGKLKYPDGSVPDPNDLQ